MKHILSFSSAEAQPKLYLRSDGMPEELSLSGEHHFSFSPHKACIGYKGAESSHACSNRAVNVRQCPNCSYRDVSRVYTVGDFSLYPELHETLSSEKYVIYLAQFGADITKVGLTRRSRLNDRWKEQGADFAAAILEFDGPDDAYPAEQLLQGMLDVVGSVRATQKFSRMHFDSTKAQTRIEKMIAKVQSDPNFSEYLSECKAVDMSNHYPKISNPQAVEFVGGKIIGAKGPWLFYEGPSGQQYGVDMHLQVGRFLILRSEEEGLFSNPQPTQFP